MLLVTLDIFSGRPNPSWILDEQEAREVLRDITINQGVVAEANSGYDGLGYRGIQLELLDDEAVEQFHLPSVFKVANGASLYESKGLEIAERLITRMPNETSVNRFTESSLVLDEDFRRQLLDNLGIFPTVRYSSIVDPTLPRALDAEMMAAASRCSIEVGKFNPGFWNVPAVVGKNNCYNYATNRRTDTFAQPGRATGHFPYPMQCADVTSAALSDGLHKQYDCFPDTEQPRYFVALVVAPGVDYHWYRYQADGFWGHKPGGTPAKNVDNSGKIVYSPEACDRTSGWPSYSQFCGYFYTASSIKVN
jgi:hypothetical protein